MFMSWNLAAPRIAENPDAVRTLFDEVAPETRALIIHTAQITAVEEVPTLLGVAEACEMTTWEAVGRLTDLATRLQDAGRASWFILPQVDQRPRPDGMSEWDHRVLRMTDADAELVLGF